MKTTQGNVLFSLRNVQGFLQDNAARLAAVIDNVMTKRLNDAIVTLSGHATDQVQTFIDAKSTTQTQEALRTELIQFHMAPINRIAKLELGSTPELSPFLMPRGKPTIEKLKPHFLNIWFKKRHNKGAWLRASLLQTCCRAIAPACCPSHRKFLNSLFKNCYPPSPEATTSRSSRRSRPQRHASGICAPPPVSAGRAMSCLIRSRPVPTNGR